MEQWKTDDTDITDLARRGITMELVPHWYCHHFSNEFHG